MNELDHLVAQCLATPGDDAPRLVWADHVGGERGELVVLQCELARGGLDVATRSARRRRERELLLAHEVEWAGELGEAATHWQFRRGFLEAARFTTDPTDDVLLAAPFLASVTVHGDDVDVARLLRLPQLRGVCLDASAFARVPRTAWRRSDLRSLGIDGLQTLGHLRDVVAHHPIEQLWLDRHTLGAKTLERILAMMPRLVALDTTSDYTYNGAPPLAYLSRAPLRALRAKLDWEELLQVASSSAGTFEYLSLDDAWEDIEDLRELIAAPGLARVRAIEVFDATDLILALEEDDELMPDLHTIRAERSNFAHLDDLERPTMIELQSHTGRMDGPLLRLSSHDELMYAEPGAMGSCGEACFARLPDFQLTSRGSTWLFHGLPLKSITIGGGPGCDVKFDYMPAGYVSADWREQVIELQWRDHAHYVIDRGPRPGGLRIDGEIVAESRITDGCKFTVGELVFGYELS